MRVKTIHLIHHSHLDVGYTELPGKILHRHIGFIRQALRIAQNHADFKWVVDTFWPLEEFLHQASALEKERLATAIRQGQIDVSANYLNFTENLGYSALRNVTQRSVEFGSSIGVDFKHAMTADINGHSLAFAQALADRGIQYLFSCIHTHHGMFPLFRCQTPFYWELPQGEQILVWNGEHYFLGNSLGLMPQAAYLRPQRYLVNDDFQVGEDELTIAERRLPRYLDHLESSGYPYDFVPLMVSGLITDNAPPNVQILSLIKKWNQKHGDKVRLVLLNLSDFFQRLDQEAASIPVYRGVWPDWWSDGFLGDPAGVRIFRMAQRHYHRFEKLARHHPEIQQAPLTEVVQLLALYAEHTFGHSDTLTYPSHWMVHATAIHKQHYAVNAMECIETITDQALEQLGARPYTSERSVRYELLNPHDHEYAGLATLYLENIDLDLFELHQGLNVMDCDSGAVLPHQQRSSTRGQELCISVVLAPGERQKLELVPVSQDAAVSFLTSSPIRGVDRVEDISINHSLSIEENCLNTPWVHIAWSQKQGIHTWKDLKNDLDLLRTDRKHAAFTPIYERSPCTDTREERRQIGRNRKRENVQRSVGLWQAVLGSEVGEVFAKVVLAYQLPGTESCVIELVAYRDRPQVDVTLLVHKTSCKDAENLYLSMPFGLPDRHELWLDTSVHPFRPWKDQIPGSLTDFFTVHEGVALCSENYGIAVATRDSGVMQLGDLQHKPRILAGMPALEHETGHLYAWLMTNYWETNFPVNLAGFHQFQYSVMWGEAYQDPKVALQQCQDVNEGIYCYLI